MFCVGYGIYKSIFHNKHKTLYNLFSPGPAVSCVADTQASHHVVFHLGVCHFICSYMQDKYFRQKSKG